MLSANFHNLFEIHINKAEHGLSEEEFTSFNSQFEHYKQLILSRNQGFLDLGEQPENIQKINDYSKTVEGKFSDIVILGIGGSMLGPITILDALVRNQKLPKVHCLDNIDPVLIAEIAHKIDLKKTLFLVQTKSGETPETLAQYLYFRDLLQKADLDVKNHFVFITDPHKGYLRKVATAENIPTFDIPENVGGRFSVLTPVGLLIAALVGLDISQLLEGARDAKIKYFDKNDFCAYKLAVSQFILNLKGKNITVLMPYSSQLKTMATWYTQLLSESTGKKFNLDKQEVYTGLTPLPALGVTDQHSQLQLFQEGPNNKFIVFLEVENFDTTIQIPTENDSLNTNQTMGQDSNSDSLAIFNSKSFNQLLKAELEGTKASLTESLRPNISLRINKINEYNLGEIFMFLQISVAFLGELLQIDTYNQPGVERSKILAKQNLLAANN